MTEAKRMTDEALAEAKALTDAATPGPWNYDQFTEFVTGDGRLVAAIDADTMTDADGFFIAAARQLVPALLAHIEAVEAENKALRDELENIKTGRRAQMKADFEAFEARVENEMHNMFKPGHHLGGKS